jgi:hypothetical protein
MLKIEIDCHIMAHDEDTKYGRAIATKATNIYKFNVDLNMAIMRIIMEHGEHAKAHEHDEMEKNSELPF